MLGDFLFQFRRNGQIVEVPFSITSINEKVLNGELKPEDNMKSIEDKNYGPLYNRPELIPFRELRKDMIEAFQRYDEETAIWRCDQILDFDKSHSNPERIDALLVKGMIMHEKDPKQAEKCYLECLDFPDADLFPVALNNLGVINLELNNVPKAIACFEEAAYKDPDFMAAQMNLSLAYRELARARKRSHTDDKDYATLALEKEKEIFEKVKADPKLLDRLLERRDFPSTNEALILYYGDVPSAFGFPKEHGEFRILAKQCYQVGIEAMAHKRYDAAILMFKIAIAYDRTLIIDAQHQIDVAKNMIRLSEETSQQKWIDQVMHEIDESQISGRLEKAVDAATNLQGVIKNQEQRQQIANLIGRLKKELAKKHFEEGCSLEEDGNIGEAKDRYLEAVRYDRSFQEAVDIRLAIIKARELWKEFKKAMDRSDFDLGLQIAMQMRALNQNAPFSREADAMEHEARKRMWNAFEKARELMQKGDPEKAKEEFFRARLTGSEDDFQTESMFKLLRIFEEEPAMRNAIAFFIQSDFEASFIAIRKVLSEVKSSEHLKEFKDIFYHTVALKDLNFISRRISRAKQLMDQKRWKDALQELEDALVLDPMNLEIARLEEEIAYKELHEKAKLAIAARDFQKAIEAYDGILQRNPCDIEALHGRAFCELRTSGLSIDNQERALNLVKEAYLALRERDYGKSMDCLHQVFSLFSSFPLALEIQRKVLGAVKEMIMTAKSRVVSEPEQIHKELQELQRLVEICGDELDAIVFQELENITEMLDQWTRKARTPSKLEMLKRVFTRKLPDIFKKAFATKKQGGTNK